MNTRNPPNGVDDMTNKKQIMFRVPTTFHETLKAYASENKLTMTKLYGRAVDYFIQWFQKSPETRRQSLISAPSSGNGKQYRLYLEPEKIDQLNELKGNHPTPDFYFTVVWRWAKDHGLLGEDVKTPGNCIIAVDKEVDKLIRFLIFEERYANKMEFYEQAVQWWLDKYWAKNLNEPYLSRPTASTRESDDDESNDELLGRLGLVRITINASAELHNRLQRIADLDGQTLRIVYYNTVIRYLDFLLDQAPTNAPEHHYVSYPLVYVEQDEPEEPEKPKEHHD